MEKSKIIENLFYYIVDFSYLILPIGFLFLKNRKKEKLPVSLLIYGIVCFSFLLFYEYYKHDLSRTTKHYFKTSYTLFEYGIFAFIFWVTIRNKNLKKFIVLSSAGFFVFQVVYALTSKIQRLDSVPIGIETILVLIYIFLFFYEFSKNLNTLYVYNHYGFWIAVGILIYLGGSFFFYLSINQLSVEEINTFGDLTYLAEVIKNILFALALYMYVRHHNEPTEKKPESVPFLDMI